MPNVFKFPKVQLALTLTLIYLTVFIKYPTFTSFYLLFTALGFTIFFDLLFVFLRLKKLFIPYAAIVTGLIIALIIDPTALWYETLVICALAMASKNFLKISNRHIFNPAAFGLFLGGIILNLNVSWWGVSFQSIIKFSPQNLIFFLILLLPALVSINKIRRYGSILSFLVIYTLAIFALIRPASISSFFTTLLNPTLIFFSIVMLPEPMTSPTNLGRQIAYGTSVALFSLILTYPLISSFLSKYNLLPDLLTPALLLGNLVFFKYK